MYLEIRAFSRCWLEVSKLEISLKFYTLHLVLHLRLSFGSPFSNHTIFITPGFTWEEWQVSFASSITVTLGGIYLFGKVKTKIFKSGRKGQEDNSSSVISIIFSLKDIAARCVYVCGCGSVCLLPSFYFAIEIKLVMPGK